MGLEMSLDIIQNRLQQYNCQTRMEEINALKEITQEIALMALSKADFFKYAEFHGGTALRILHGMQRFSEDLDFALLKPSDVFDLAKYIETMSRDFEAYGYQVWITERKNVAKTVQKQFLKIDSLGSELNLIYPVNRAERKIKIKFELDTNPPAGANVEIEYLTFPLAFSVLARDLPSQFSGKLHAILCRSFDKGRDWYDFVWFVGNSVKINYKLLKNAIYQQGPWAGKNIHIDHHWVIATLRKIIPTKNWVALTQDISPLLRSMEQDSVKIWSTEFFLKMTERLEK